MCSKMQGFTQLFQNKNIMTMASGGQPAKFVFYFYAQNSTSDIWFLVNLTASSIQQTASVLVKCNEVVPALMEQFESLVRSIVC